MLLGVVSSLFSNGRYVNLKPHLSLEHGWTSRTSLVFNPEGHRTRHRMTQFCYLKTKHNATRKLVTTFKKPLTERKAWIKSALTVAKAFPFTKIVKVSSFSVVMRLPNQDFLVSSGEDSGVKWTSSEEAKVISEWISKIWYFNYVYLAFFSCGIEETLGNYFWLWWAVIANGD